MNKTVDHWVAVADTLKQQRDQAEKERDALRKDTARLDWLEGKAVSFTAHQWATGDWTMTLSEPSREKNGLRTRGFAGRSLREAIDAAMEATP
jgi:hypothetical protein